MHEVTARLPRDDADASLHALRTRWRTASLAGGWPFPSDWALPEVDLVCASVIAGAELGSALSRLGRARATAGAGLAETLSDLAALHAVLSGPSDTDGVVAADPDAAPARLLRLTALGWAEVSERQAAYAEVCDGLTGLATAGYLRTRLGEVYRGATLRDVQPATEYVLLTVRLDLSTVAGWSRLAALVIVSDVLRSSFAGDETLATLGPSTAAVLTKRYVELGRKVSKVRRELTARLAIDDQLRAISTVQVRTEPLPAGYEAACALLTKLATC
ncbi:MAG: GGDEF domain-containing protein [Sciscionella sp.]|nr:GGDEF domain-containing protein [Sciscionella sp.]